MSPKSDRAPPPLSSPVRALLRVDVWLWRARLFKSRALAADAVSAGAVRLVRAGASRALGKPAELVGIDDGLSVRTPRGVVTVRILALGQRRGPPAEARALYQPITDQAEGSDDPDA
jgi:ribosome-associated heat shock protein Hsp15